MTLHHMLYRKTIILISTCRKCLSTRNPKFPGTAPIPGTGIRPRPNGLVPTDSPFNPVQLPEPTLPLGPYPRETPKRPETWRFWPMNG
jgi:hypothetical protein